MTPTRAGSAPARLLGAGGEAEVFEVPGRPHLAFKRYRRPNAEKASKLQTMIQHPPDVEGASAALAWPVEVATGPGGDVTGFLMPRIDLATSVSVFRVYNPQSRQKVAPAFTWLYLMRSARNVAAIVDAVHRAGHVIGDLNESNLLVSNRALVSLVDCDSMQVTDPSTGEVHPCPVGKPEFTAPELYRRRDGLRPRTTASDSFALGVVIFQLLMEGAHPFAGVWLGRGEAPDIAARMRRGRFPYRWASRIKPPPMALPIEVLPPALRRLVWRSFAAGLRRPRRRPTPAQWMDALARVEDELTACLRSPHHVYAAHLRDCPWCRRIDIGLPDPFPGPTGVSPLRARPPTRIQVWKASARRSLARTRRRAQAAVRSAPSALVGIAAKVRRRDDASAQTAPGVTARRSRPFLSLILLEIPLLAGVVVASALVPALALPALAVAVPSLHAAYQSGSRGRGRVGRAVSLAALLPGNLAAFALRLGAVVVVGLPATVLAASMAVGWGGVGVGGRGILQSAVAVAPVVVAGLMLAAGLLPGRVHQEWPAGVAVARARLRDLVTLRLGAIAWLTVAALTLALLR